MQQKIARWHGRWKKPVQVMFTPDLQTSGALWPTSRKFNRSFRLDGAVDVLDATASALSVIALNLDFAKLLAPWIVLYEQRNTVAH